MGYDFSVTVVCVLAYWGAAVLGLSWLGKQCEETGLMYCDHKTTNNCPDCMEELIALRKEVRRLKTFKAFHRTCPDCNGFGRSNGTTCPECGGSGDSQYPAQTN